MRACPDADDDEGAEGGSQGSSMILVLLHLCTALAAVRPTASVPSPSVWPPSSSAVAGLPVLVDTGMSLSTPTGGMNRTTRLQMQRTTSPERVRHLITKSLRAVLLRLRHRSIMAPHMTSM